MCEISLMAAGATVSYWYHVTTRDSVSMSDQRQAVEDEAHPDVVGDHPPGHIFYT